MQFVRDPRGAKVMAALGTTPERITPETVAAVVSEMQMSRGIAPQPPAPPVKRDIRNVGGSLLEIPAEGDPRLLYREPQSQSQGQPIEAPADQRLFQWFSQLTPEQQAAYLNMKRSNATPEAAAAVAGAKTTAQEQAKSTAAAQADLPRAESNASDMRTALSNLKSAPGLKYIFGAASLVPPIPGTAQADAFAIWEQVQGKAFLEAFNTLKGGGQITEKEGAKATAAITRLSNRRQSLESAKAAIGELEGVVQAAENRARARAGIQGAAKPGAKAPPNPGENVKGYIYIGGDPADRKNWVKTR